jgi:hypothetical protein
MLDNVFISESGNKKNVKGCIPYQHRNPPPNVLVHEHRMILIDASGILRLHSVTGATRSSNRDEITPRGGMAASGSTISSTTLRVFLCEGQGAGVPIRIHELISWRAEKYGPFRRDFRAILMFRLSPTILMSFASSKRKNLTLSFRVSSASRMRVAVGYYMLYRAVRLYKTHTHTMAL